VDVHVHVDNYNDNDTGLPVIEELEILTKSFFFVRFFFFFVRSSPHQLPTVEVFPIISRMASAIDEKNLQLESLAYTSKNFFSSYREAIFEVLQDLKVVLDKIAYIERNHDRQQRTRESVKGMTLAQYVRGAADAADVTPLVAIMQQLGSEFKTSPIRRVLDLSPAVPHALRTDQDSSSRVPSDGASTVSDAQQQSPLLDSQSPSPTGTGGADALSLSGVDEASAMASSAAAHDRSPLRRSPYLSLVSAASKRASVSSSLHRQAPSSLLAPPAPAAPGLAPHSVERKSVSPRGRITTVDAQGAPMEAMRVAALRHREKRRDDLVKHLVELDDMKKALELQLLSIKHHAARGMQSRVERTRLTQLQESLAADLKQVQHDIDTSEGQIEKLSRLTVLIAGWKADSDEVAAASAAAAAAVDEPDGSMSSASATASAAAAAAAAAAAGASTTTAITTAADEVSLTAFDSSLLTHDGAMAWAPDGDLYVRRAHPIAASDSTYRIVRYNGKSGAPRAVLDVREPAPAERSLYELSKQDRRKSAALPQPFVAYRRTASPLAAAAASPQVAASPAAPPTATASAPSSPLLTAGGGGGGGGGDEKRRFSKRSTAADARSSRRRHSVNAPRAVTLTRQATLEGATYSADGTPRGTTSPPPTAADMLTRSTDQTLSNSTAHNTPRAGAEKPTLPTSRPPSSLAAAPLRAPFDAGSGGSSSTEKALFLSNSSGNGSGAAPGRLVITSSPTPLGMSAVARELLLDDDSSIDLKLVQRGGSSNNNARKKSAAAAAVGSNKRVQYKYRNKSEDSSSDERSR
jgi:hypothetical protein